MPLPLNKSMLSDWFSAVLQTSRKCERYKLREVFVGFWKETRYLRSDADRG
mgnify:CR=1 FL=1